MAWKMDRRKERVMFTYYAITTGMVAGFLLFTEKWYFGLGMFAVGVPYCLWYYLRYQHR